MDIPPKLQRHIDWIKTRECGPSAEPPPRLDRTVLYKTYLLGLDLHRCRLRYADLRYSLLSKANLEYADLAYANLEEAQLDEARLVMANLAGANLRYVNAISANFQYSRLSKANLDGTDLAFADLGNTVLTEANLRETHLYGANLHRSKLVGADLRGADLRKTNLYCAILIQANLAGARLPSPTMLLLAWWNKLPDDITVQLMRLDASAHPEGIAAFNRWSRGGLCPYESCQFQRVANFREQRELWSPGPPPTIIEACKMVLDHCCPGWDK